MSNDNENEIVSKASRSINSPTNIGSPFVNVGLLKFNQERARWLKKVKITKGTSHRTNLNLDAITDLLLSNRWRQQAPNKKDKSNDGSFSSPVPLPQMVDLLVDLWEGGGLG